MLFHGSGVDDAAEQTAVADGVLLSLVALVQELVVEQQHLTAQRVQLVQRRGACQEDT